MICIICTRLFHLLVFSFSSLFLDSFAVARRRAFARTEFTCFIISILQNMCYLCVRDMKRGSSQCEQQEEEE